MILLLKTVVCLDEFAVTFINKFYFDIGAKYHLA